MIQPIGYFKLWRELMTKPIWESSTPIQKTILITLLAMANYNDKEWEWQGENYKAEKGQFVTSIASIVKNCGKGVSTQNTRTALERFEKYDFLTIQTTNKNSLITVVNWGVYQQTEENQQANQHLPNKRLTTREEGKEGKEIVYTEIFEIFYKLYPNPFDKEQTYRNWNNLIKEVKIEIVMAATKKYIKFLKDNNKTDKTYFFKSTNFVSKKGAYKGYLEPITEPPKKPVKLNIIYREFGE